MIKLEFDYKELESFLVERKKQLPRGQERNGYALCIEDLQEFYLAQIKLRVVK